MKEAMILYFLDEWVAVEYDDNRGFVQRKFIPRELVSTTLKGPTFFDEVLLNMGMEISNAHVVAILEDLSIDSVYAMTVQEDFRRADFWTVKDYEANPMGVLQILKKRAVPVDVFMFNNELHRRIL